MNKSRKLLHNNEPAKKFIFDNKDMKNILIWKHFMENFDMNIPSSLITYYKKVEPPYILNNEKGHIPIDVYKKKLKYAKILMKPLTGF